MPYVGTSTSSTNFDRTVQTLIQKTLYALLRAGTPHLPRGSVIPASFKGKNSGGNGTFRFNSVPDLDATPGSHDLTEGVPPAGQELDFGFEEFTANQKGDFVRLTDATILKNPHGLAGVAADRIAEQQRRIIDRMARDLWLSGTNVIYSGSGNTDTDEVAAGDVLLSVDLKRAVALLASTNVARLDGAYLGILHPFVKFDLTLDDDAGGWIDANRYAGSKALFSGEIGTFAGVRLIESSEAGVKADQGTGSIDVYSTTIIGAESIAFGDLGTQEIIVERGGVSDPLHQVETVGWKAWLGGCLVSEGTSATSDIEPRYVRIESASTL